MDKDLKRKDQQISELSARSDQLQQRKAETEARISTIEAEIPEVQKAIMAAYTNGDDLVELDRRRLQLRNDLEVARLGLTGLTEAIENVENQLSAAITSRNTRFSELAGKWLTREAEGYNRAVDQVRESVRRLFGVRKLLGELGDNETFRQALGPAGDHLHKLVLMKLDNSFTVTRLTPDEQRRALRATQDLCAELFQEVCR